MAEEFSKSHQDIYFASMHPGWSDTPGVQSALPKFYDSMHAKLITTLQGADTMIWLAISPSVKGECFPSGSFFQDRAIVSKHLPLAWTHSNDAEQAELMKKLSKLAEQYK